MSWYRQLFGPLLAAALVAHVFMLAGHGHGGADHASIAGVITHLDVASSTPTVAVTDPDDPGAGAATLGAACLVVLVGVVRGRRRRQRRGAADRASVRCPSPRRARPPAASPPLRPPRTPIAERVVLLT